jgi:hypothetical protein
MFSVSNDKMMDGKIAFIKRGILFVAVFLILIPIFFGLQAYIFFFSGESIGLDEVLNRQSRGDNMELFGMAYSDQTRLYKLKLLESRNCNIVALGSSRIMQLRDHFFNTSFCNAGGGATKINEFKLLIQKMLESGKRPKLVIISLDQYYFNSKWDNGKSKIEPGQYDPEENYYSIFLSNISKINSDYLEGKIKFGEISSKKSGYIGLTAVMKGSGFRNDGSYLYGDVIEKGGIKNKDYEDFNFKDTFSRIQKGTSRFEYGATVSDYSIDELDSFLDYCYKNNIQVIGFMPPFAKEVWGKIDEYKDEYKYMFGIYNQTKPIFDKYNFEVYDFSDLNKVNASNCEVIDGFHGSEKAYLRMVIYMADNGTILKNFADLNYLNKKLTNSKGCFLTDDQPNHPHTFEYSKAVEINHFFSQNFEKL